jgi:FG-GAP repeat
MEGDYPLPERTRRCMRIAAFLFTAMSITLATQRVAAQRTKWVRYAVAPLTASGDRYVSVALNEDASFAAVGEPMADSEAGAVYIFAQHDGSWFEEQKISAPDAAVGRFGFSVSMSGTTLAVGAPGTGQQATSPRPGGVYMFVRTSIAVWKPQTVRLQTQVLPQDALGISVALNGGR